MDSNILSQIMQPMKATRASFALDYPALKSFEMGDTTAASDTLPSLQFPTAEEAQQAAMSLQAPKLPQFVFPEFKTPAYEPPVSQSPQVTELAPRAETPEPTQTQALKDYVQKTEQDLEDEHNEYLKLISKPLPEKGATSPFFSFIGSAVR